MTRKTEPLVSIGMPVRNCELTLPRAVRSLLAQTHANWELLLIDDGSSDETVAVAGGFADPRIRVVQGGRSRGLPTRLNQAVELSRGKYFARMDGDDVAFPQRLEMQVRYLEEHPEVDLTSTWVLVFGHDGLPLGKRTGPESHEAICARPLAGFPMAHPTFAGRLDWYSRYGYNEKMRKAQDQELLLRSYRGSRFANVPELLLGYREEKINLSKVLLTRWYFALAAFSVFSAQREPGMALRALVPQGFKGVADWLAVKTGLNYRLLRHRARPLTAEDRQVWAGVWALVGGNGLTGRG